MMEPKHTYKEEFTVRLRPLPSPCLEYTNSDFAPRRQPARPGLSTKQPSIRLLEPDRSNSITQKLTYNLKSYLLSDHLRYKALSYACNENHTDNWFDTMPTPVGALENGRSKPEQTQGQHYVFCNGSRVAVGMNLFDALTNLWEYENSLLWVDVLCINFDDNDERSSQVYIMAEIYGQAEVVIAWLGQERDDAVGAKEVHDTLAGPVFDLFKEGRLGWQDVIEHDPQDPSFMQEYGLAHVPLMTLILWTDFFRRSYFARCWTLQEITFARRVELRCGSLVFNWPKLRFLVQYLQRSGWRSYMNQLLGPIEYEIGYVLMPVEFAATATRELGGWEKECRTVYKVFNFAASLCEILYRTLSLDCSDPRDKLFSMFALLRQIHKLERLPINIDYTCTVVDLYRQLVELCLSTMPDLTILSLVQHPRKQRTSGLPSWIPDLHAYGGRISPLRLGIGRRRPEPPIHNAAFRSLNVPERRRIEHDRLYLQGRCLGVVKTTGFEYNRYNRLDMHFMCRMVDIYMGLPLILRNGQHRSEGMWRAFIVDSNASSRIYSTPASDELRLGFADFILYQLFAMRAMEDPKAVEYAWNCLQNICVDELDINLLPWLSNQTSWLERLTQHWQVEYTEELKRYMTLDRCWNFKLQMNRGDKILFSTKEGDIGQGSPNIQLGDEVWLLENGRVPFILRPSEEACAGIKSFRMIGECYLYGVMQGELFDKGEVEFEPICLV